MLDYILNYINDSITYFIVVNQNEEIIICTLNNDSTIKKLFKIVDVETNSFKVILLDKPNIWLDLLNLVDKIQEIITNTDSNLVVSSEVYSNHSLIIIQINTIDTNIEKIKLTINDSSTILINH